MAVITQELHRAGCYLAESAPYNIVNEEIIVASGQGILKPGQVLAKLQTGAATLTPGSVVSGSGGTPGNGSIGTVTADAGAAAGTYQVRILNPATNAGAFEVLRPDGSVDGNGTVGVAYNGTINFTLADGSTDFVEDDRIPVALSYAVGNKWVKHDPDATNGAQHAEGILYDRVDATSADKRAVATVNGPGNILPSWLIFKTGISAANKAAALARFAAKLLKVLPQHAV